MLNLTRTVPVAAALAMAAAAPASALAGSPIGLAHPHAGPQDIIPRVASVDRTRQEQTSIRLLSKKLQVDEDRRVNIKVRCSTRAACTGTVRVRVGNGSDRHPKRYRVAGGRTVTIPVGLTPTAFRKIVGTKTLATVTLTEKGHKGERSVEQRLPIRGRAPRA